MLQRFAMLLFSACALTLLAYAQPDPTQQPAGGAAIGGPPPPPPGMQQPVGGMKPDTPAQLDPRALMTVATPSGLFLFSAGTLTRFEAKLQDPYVTLPLLGLMPEQPRPDANANEQQQRQALQKYTQEIARRSMPGAMTASGDALLLVFGDTFYRINQRTLVIEAKTDLRAKPEGDDANRITWRMPPVLAQHGELLYIIRGTELLAVNSTTGELLGRHAMPKELLPQVQPMLLYGEAQRRDPAGAVAAKPVTLVGTLVRHAEQNRIVWTVKDEQNAEYVLQGEIVDKLAQLADANGRRVRITGELIQRADLPTFAKGVLRVTNYQSLNEP